MRGLTTAEAVAIYRTLYWDALAADELPPGLDHALFDFAVHSGVPRAASSAFHSGPPVARMDTSVPGSSTSARPN